MRQDRRLITAEDGAALRFFCQDQVRLGRPGGCRHTSGPGKKFNCGKTPVAVWLIFPENSHSVMLPFCADHDKAVEASL